MAQSTSIHDSFDYSRGHEAARRASMAPSAALLDDLGELGQLDAPFADEDALLPQFVAYLRAKGVAETFLPAFEREARTFRSRFPNVPTERLDSEMVEMHLQEGRARSLSERALRNRHVGVQAYLDFLHARRGARSTARTPPVPAKSPADKRRDPRVPFITDVKVDDFGVRRSADISVGGIYLETLTTAVRGTPLRLQFKLHPSDHEPITATARVSFVHPQFGAGLEFLSLSPEDTRRIADYVAHVTRASARQDAGPTSMPWPG